MEKELFGILYQMWHNEISVKETHRQILSLMGEKELGGSDATIEHGDLHCVRESHVSGDASDSEASVNGLLEKRTEDENVCSHCKGKGKYYAGHYGAKLVRCRNCKGKGTIVEDS